MDLDNQPTDHSMAIDLPSSDFRHETNHLLLPTTYANTSTFTPTSSQGNSPAVQVTTPELEQINHFQDYVIQQGSLSPTNSAASTAQIKDEVTPRAELPQPAWPSEESSAVQSPYLENHTAERMQLDQENESLDRSTSRVERAQQKPYIPIGREASWRRKHGSLDTPPQLARLVGAIEDLRSTPYQSLVLDNGDQSHVSGFAPRAIDTPSSPGGYHTSSRAGESSRSPPPAEQRVVAQSSDTGNRISAPLSPPAHYPGSARPSSRRNSSSRTLNEVTSSDSSSTTSSGSSLASLQNSVTSMSSNGKPAPRWAHPPRYTNKISGRAWSFSQGQERPDVDFDPELFEGPEPEAVLEIMKGMEGRIAVKTTPAEYNIMAWLPGFSIDDITISMKGDRTVQIVADLWEEEDHAQWNVLLGEDVNKNAIAATFKGAELRVTVKRNPPPSSRSIRSTFSSWSAPAKVSTPSMGPSVALSPNHPDYPQVKRAAPQMSH